jgi:hypothetical protein
MTTIEPFRWIPVDIDRPPVGVRVMISWGVYGDPEPGVYAGEGDGAAGRWFTPRAADVEEEPLALEPPTHWAAWPTGAKP